MALAVAGERYTLRSRESSSTLRWLLAFSLSFKVRPSWLLRIAIGAAVLAARGPRPRPWRNRPTRSGCRFPLRCVGPLLPECARPLSLSLRNMSSNTNRG